MQKELGEVLERIVAEQATGCVGAGSYREYARLHGYPYLHVWDWTSSAGDWSFLVSKDGKDWVWMFQNNNYPRPGFTWTINEEGDHYYADDEDSLFAMVQEAERW